MPWSRKTCHRVSCSTLSNAFSKSTSPNHRSWLNSLNFSTNNYACQLLVRKFKWHFDIEIQFDNMIVSNNESVLKWSLSISVFTLQIRETSDTNRNNETFLVIFKHRLWREKIASFKCTIRHGIPCFAAVPLAPEKLLVQNPLKVETLAVAA